MKKKSTIYNISIIGAMSAVICVLGPLSIPIGVIPISFTNLAIYIILYVLGQKKGTISYLIYLLIGFIGIPVFSGFTGGPAKLIGPTGGYLVGFIFMSLIAGFFIDRFITKWYLCMLGMILGTIVCYFLGTLWFSYQANLTFSVALGYGVTPFVIGDFCKICIAAVIGPQIKKLVNKQTR